MINFRKVNSLEGGLSTDLTDNIERKNTYSKSVGGRLFSKNGVMSLSGGAGTKLIYENQDIVKYLGFYSFEDEIIVLAKCVKGLSAGGSTETVYNNLLTASSFFLEKNSTDNSAFELSSEISDSTQGSQNSYEVHTPAENPADFKVPYSIEGNITEEFDYSLYYKINNNIRNEQACDIDINEILINNLDYDDCFLSLKLSDDNYLYGSLLWVGKQNWPLNGKITTEGVHENEFYKRVYYTDSVNPRRVVNVKDSSLPYRKAYEFNQILNNVLLQPEIDSINPGGQLKGMKVLYISRIISENGQVSEFSPTSAFAKILFEDTPVKYRGADISEVTGKSVKVKCNIINPQSSSEVECIAIEYEALGPPTAIRNLGRKAANTVVYFDHYGNEPESSDNITYNDIVSYTNTWKYCNDFSSKKNKLIAAGLRNEPTPTEINNLEYLFPLHSWKANGETHESLINPEPWNYRYIDPTNNSELIYVKRKIYRTISSFGPLTLRLKNTANSVGIEKTFNDIGLESYTSISSLVIAWILSEQVNNVNFNNYFPNLSVSNINGQLLFNPENEALKTDMSVYVFESNNNQYIENFDNDIAFLKPTLNLSKLVHGAQSIGFNKGTGIRVTYREFKVPLLNQATKTYDGTGKLVDFEKPSGETFCMKGEIYRIAFQSFNNDSTRFFSIPLGDLMIPSLGDLKSFIDDSGSVVITSEKYVNQSVSGGVLYGHGIKMHIEVRLSCELQRLIPMYQIVYVERDEDNRTILCQGISAPLERVQDNNKTQTRLTEALRNKWNLPYYGGPTYEKRAFENYDSKGENYQYQGDSAAERVMAHRALMYFDSPDLYFNKISDQFISSSKVNIVGKLNTDHTPSLIRNRGGQSGGGINEIYPKFSRKILERQIEGTNYTDDYPKYDLDRGSNSGTDASHWFNFSVYANFTPYNQTKNISASKTLNRGEITSGSELNVENDVSNNAACLAVPEWYYGDFQRKWDLQGGGAKSEIFMTAMTSPGYKTTIIKTDSDLFTTSFFGTPLPAMDNRIRLGGTAFTIHYDTIPLINIFRNNRESIFGGRSIEAYSKNTYIPLSKTIPVLKESTAAQFFDVGADVYVTLNIRLKNDYGDDEIRYDSGYNNSGETENKNEIETWTRNGAWMYAVVLESQVEPKDTYQYEFYRESGTHNFEASRGELINPAYFNENKIKSYVPKPFKFKDDPNQGNVIAVSNVKLSGEYYDSWTLFKPNNFYSLLEKNKGDISNLVKENEDIFAIQSQQTSLIYIGTDRIITDSEGGPINLQQGSGTVVDGHKVISNYGTSIRRATCENPFGFTFFDERKVEFVKIKTGLLNKYFCHLHYFNKHKNDPVIDTECYYDLENSETCIRIRTKNGNNYVLSYNEHESIKAFNGEFPIQYDKDLFMMFDEKVYAPIRTGIDQNISSSKLHQLNQGDILNFFETDTDLVFALYINADIDKVFQYKQIGIVTNINYPVDSIFGKSNLGYDRTIYGTHEWYKIREGTHTVPLVNESNDPNEYSDVRGAWVYLEIKVKSLNKNKVNILAVINDLRYSHQ